MDTSVEASETLEAIEAGSSVHCASVRQGDIVILGSAGLLLDNDLDAILTLCNESLPPISGPDFVPTPLALLAELANQIASVAAVAPQDDATSTSEDGRQLPRGSVVVAEVVRETLGDSSSHSSSSTSSPAKVSSSTTTPEKTSPNKTSPYKDAVRIHSVVEDTLYRGAPCLEGAQETKSCQCGIGFGEFKMSFYAELPPAPRQPAVPARRKVQRTITNDEFD
jgi:hypothetical protein